MKNVKIKQLNIKNAGFSLIEVLGVIVILGILSIIAIAGYQRYQDKSVKTSYDTMIRSAASAAENYFMDESDEDRVSFATLMDNNYLEKTIDPKDKTKLCEGSVKINDSSDGDEESISEQSYVVNIKCTNYQTCKVYPSLGMCDESMKENLD